MSPSARLAAPVQFRRLQQRGPTSSTTTWPTARLSAAVTAGTAVVNSGDTGSKPLRNVYSCMTSSHECEECGAKFDSERDLERHLRDQGLVD